MLKLKQNDNVPSDDVDEFINNLEFLSKTQLISLLTNIIVNRPVDALVCDWIFWDEDLKL